MSEYFDVTADWRVRRNMEIGGNNIMSRFSTALVRCMTHYTDPYFISQPSFVTYSRYSPERLGDRMNDLRQCDKQGDRRWKSLVVL
jgi:hypothetical protein